MVCHVARCHTDNRTGRNETREAKPEDGKRNMARKLTRAEKIGVQVGLGTIIVAAVGIALTFFVPEVRRKIGLDKTTPGQVGISGSALPRPPVESELPASAKPEIKQQSKNRVKGNNNVTGSNVAGNGNAVGNNNQVTTASPVVNNAPGGIINNGGIMTNPTVNNFRPPPKHLTNEQRNQLSEGLKSTPSDVIIWAIGGDNEAWNFGQDLCAALRQAGWRVENNDVQAMIAGGPLYPDMAVFVNPEDAKNLPNGIIHLNNGGAYQLVVLLRSFDFTVGVVTSEKVPRNFIKVVMGPPKT
jgi:hypothetical protein